MPTSNETRVRVDGRSKIIANVLPSERTRRRLRAFDPRRLDRRGAVEDAAELPGGKLEQIEEMPGLGLNRRVHGSFS